MGLAHSAVAFDNTVTTAFSNGLTWSAVGTVSGNRLTLWSLVVAVFSDQAFFSQAIVTTFGDGLPWGAVGAISGDGLTRSAVGAISSDGLTWGTVGTISGNGLAEHRVSVFHLRSGLVSGRQRKSGAGQH